MFPKGIKPYTPSSFDEVKNLRKKVIEDTEYKKFLEKGYKEGFNAGYEDGLKKGYEEGVKKSQNEIETKIEKINRIIRVFKQATEEINSLKVTKTKEVLPDILNLTVKIAEKIVAAKLSVDKKLIIAIVKEALNSVRLNEEKVIIKVNPDDYKFLKDNFKDLQVDDSKIDIQPSADIKTGGCYIETVSKEVDATLEQKLKGIEDALSSVIFEES